jgi:hypothetical protein
MEDQKNPLLLKMKWLLRPEDCEKCEYFKDPACELQRILNCKKWDVISLTYQKLKALTLSKEQSKISQEVLQKLNSADIVILDEYTSGLLGLSPTIELSDEKLGSFVSIMIDGYDEWWAKILYVANEALELGRKLTDGKCERFYNPLSEDDLLKINANFTGIWNKVKLLTVKGLETEFLQEMIQLASCKEMLVRKDKKLRITLQPINALEIELSFINSFADDFTKQGKLCALVDAHLPEFDLQKYFVSKVEPFLWGDPNNTNSSIAYFCDTRKIAEEDVFHEKTRIYLQGSINEICRLHKDAGRILVVCLNKAVANEVQRWQKQGIIADVKITYYRSDETKGVQADGYVQILIGAPYIPASSYHFKISQEAGADKATAMNTAFKNSNIHAELVNASSRVKDPNGIYQSYIYCLGITYIEISQFLNLYGTLYQNCEVKKPAIIYYAKTGMKASMWVDMTNLYQRKNEICDVEQSLPYLLELTKIFTKTAGKIKLQQAFRSKSNRAKEAFLKNVEFLLSIDIYVEKQGRGLILLLNDKNPL